MENEKSAVDEFLGNLDETQNDPFELGDKDLFVPKETKEEVVIEPKVEKPVPFNKDPKVLRFIEKEIEKRTSKTEVTPKIETQSDDEVTNVLTRIIGNDTPEKVAALKDFKKVLGGIKQEAADEAVNKFQSRNTEMREAQEREEAEAQAELESGFEDIESEFNVDLTSNTVQAKKARSEFVDFIKLVAPKDENGDVRDYPDLVETFKLHQGIKKANAQPSRAKELAARSMQRSGGSGDAKPIGGQGWDAVERLLGN